MALGLSGLISITNTLFIELITNLVVYYKLERRIFYIIEVAKNISVIQFLNTALMPFGLSYYFATSDFKIKIFSTGGLAYN